MSFKPHSIPILPPSHYTDEETEAPRCGDCRQHKGVAELGLKPRLPAPKPHIASHDWEREQQPSVTARDRNTVSAATHGQETETTANTPPPGNTNIATHLTRGHRHSPSHHPLQSPRSHRHSGHRHHAPTVTHSHSLSHRPRRCLCRSRGHRTPSPSPQATLLCTPFLHTLRALPPQLLRPQDLSPHTSFLCSLVLGKGVQPWVPIKLCIRRGQSPN